MKNKVWSLCGLAAICTIGLSAISYAQELIVYQKNYQATRGEIKALATVNLLTLSSRYGPIQLKSEEILAILRPEQNADFLKLVQSSNFKSLSRQGLLQSASVVEQADLKTWKSLEALFQGVDEPVVLVLGYKAYQDGRIDDLSIYQSSGNELLDGNVIALLAQEKLSPLTKAYTGGWVPGYLVLGPTLIRRQVYLRSLEMHFQREFPALVSRLECPYRLQILYDKTGKALYHKAHGVSFEDATIKGCKISNRQSFIEFILEKPLPSIASTVTKDDLMGLSIWVSEDGIRLKDDPEFMEESVRAEMHNYLNGRFSTEVTRYFAKLKKQQKVKLDYRNTRYARYLITLSPALWPRLQSVKLTTPSGDKTFDSLCTKTLTEMAIPKLPPVLNSKEQETVFKCELFGKN
jgi:hypothetical protein